MSFEKARSGFPAFTTDGDHFVANSSSHNPHNPPNSQIGHELQIAHNLHNPGCSAQSRKPRPAPQWSTEDEDAGKFGFSDGDSEAQIGATQ